MSNKNQLLPVARRLFGARTESDVYDIAVQALFERTDADECAFAVLENGELVSRASVTTSLIDAPAGPLADESGLIERANENGEPLVVADLVDGPWGQFRDSNPDGTAFREPIPYRSLLCVPLEREGILVATANRPEIFDAVAQQTAKGIGSLVRDALEGLTPAPATDSTPENLERAVSTLTHEMMDKLMIANSRLEAAREHPDPEHFDELADVHDRIETFIEDTARYLRTGERIPDRERIDIRLAAERAWSLVESSDVELRCHDHLKIVADEGMLSELLENLFRNCVEHGFPGDQYGPEERVVRVGRLDSGSGIYVEDNGRGIAPGHGASVFDPGTTTAADGSGHGLCICRSVASAHDWEIDATEGDGGGARFEITGVEFAERDGEELEEPTSVSDPLRCANHR